VFLAGCTHAASPTAAGEYSLSGDCGCYSQIYVSTPGAHRSLFGEEAHEVPVITMVQASEKIYDPDRPVETQAEAEASEFTASLEVLVLAVLTIIGLYRKQ